MRVAINAMQVRAAKSGVGRYIEGLLGALAAGAPEDHFTVYCTAQNRGNYELGAPNVETRAWGLPQSMRSLRLLNEYARFPGELRRGGHDVFLGPSNFLPVRKVLPSVLVIVTVYLCFPMVTPPHPGYRRRVAGRWSIPRDSRGALLLPPRRQAPARCLDSARRTATGSRSSAAHQRKDNPDQ